VLFSARGHRFTQAVAHRLADLPSLVLVCGRYEGVDERVRERLVDEELSIGD
jgi:tRNA (guanine37-N1)-methyltransferase